MGDSDEEYDRRRGREKFRKERSDYQHPDRRDDRGMRTRDDWIERNDNWNQPRRGDYGSLGARDYRNSGRERGYSPRRGHDFSPPIKRMKPDWDDRRYGLYAESGYASSNYSNYSGDNYASYSSGAALGGYGSNYTNKDEERGPTQPPMLSFKAFLTQQDDSITDQEAIKKYNEYKLDFKRQQLNEFFLAHKEEEWFRIKYHPEDCQKRTAEHKAALKRRLDVFMEFYHANNLDELSVDADQSEILLKLLDSVVIKLEGGSDFDLKVLDITESELNLEPSQLINQNDSFSSDIKKDSPNPEVEENNEEIKLDKPQEDEAEEGEEEGEEAKPKPIKESRKRKRDFEYGSGSSSSSEDSGDDEPAPPGIPGEDGSVNAEGDANQEMAVKKEEEEIDGEIKDPKLESDVPENISEKGIDEEMSIETTEVQEKPSEISSPLPSDVPLKPRPLHKTASIFLRNLAPTITKQEVEAMCKRYPGFLRAAIADPQPERRWFRRGWVTFERNVNIKEICWNLNNIRLRDCELGAIVNRDLSRRIRTVNGITSHRQVVRQDIKMAAKIIQNLDRKYALWAAEENGEDKENDPEKTFNLSSLNPLLKNITDYLIEEASAEEEELLGGTGNGDTIEKDGIGENLERDEVLNKVLDKLLLYLRIVHSVDYYNHSEYPHEDEMPNRCGIMHARGIPPSSKVTVQEVNDYCQMFEKKLQPYLNPPHKLSDDEAAKLGMKDSESEVEKFIQANTQELAKDKWLCPLSGKKFKGPEFVRKHIFNKHGEKIEEVKKEVDFYNNYLRDPKRPQLPEHPSSKQPSRGSDSRIGSEYAGMPPPASSGYNHFGGGENRRASFPKRYSSYGGYNRPASYGSPASGGYSSYSGGAGGTGGGYGRDAAQPREPYQRGGPVARYPRQRTPSGNAAALANKIRREIRSYRDWDAPQDDFV